ncbi:MAG: 16S rRNA (guanine(966)-N(2))-methyltransferase RsmD [Gammaproteobacteria bacterium]|nr:16S rRNA (guanine(966)-N(2))-methyltransferase RsmD [Gammaproteobacteria bacterium]MDH5729026.1 16S rRNA (guanine(966)-N(2))-methyltransferase RsmD [Gammaproteobacteria bacterium]
MSHKPRKTNRVRLIGGDYRGRLISFPDAKGLRPSGDRIRETLFNWLQFEIAGRCCLDLFAGSGVLGFEALSRGASAVIFCDTQPVVKQSLLGNIQQLQLQDRVQVMQQDGIALLATLAPQSVDLIFVDPPFAENAVCDCLRQIKISSCLSSNGLVYVEMDKSQSCDFAQLGWQLLKQKILGQVFAGLLVLEHAKV